MSASQTTQPMAVQIHPLAELREALFQAGMLRQRNLSLAHECHALQERVTQLETSEKASQETIDGLYAQLREVGEHE